MLGDLLLHAGAALSAHDHKDRAGAKLPGQLAPPFIPALPRDGLQTCPGGHRSTWWLAPAAIGGSPNSKKIPHQLAFQPAGPYPPGHPPPNSPPARQLDTRPGAPKINRVWPPRTIRRMARRPILRFLCETPPTPRKHLTPTGAGLARRRPQKSASPLGGQTAASAAPSVTIQNRVWFVKRFMSQH